MQCPRAKARAKGNRGYACVAVEKDTTHTAVQLRETPQTQPYATVVEERATKGESAQRQIPASKVEVKVTGKKAEAKVIGRRAKAIGRRETAGRKAIGKRVGTKARDHQRAKEKAKHRHFL